LLIGLLIILYVVLKLISKLFQKIRRTRPLSWRLKNRSDRKFNKLIKKFKYKNKRNPTRDEIFRIIINASHITIRRKGKSGHLGRQKVRKYLLEKHNVVKNYTMR